jgi:hypothetical protein
MFSVSNSSTKYVFITATLGVLFSMLHFVQKQEEKYSNQIEIIQRKLRLISSECEDIRNQLEKMKERQKDNEKYIQLSELKLIKTDTHEDEYKRNEDEEYCVEYDVHDYDDDLSVRNRSRSHSLSSVLGTAKKLVFG